jgi:ribose-phosphate pyrophosphokinase
VSTESPENYALTPEEKSELVVVSGDAHLGLSEQIAAAMDLELDPIELKWHPNSEPYVRFEESLRNKHVIIIQPHAIANGRSVNDSWRQHLEMIKAAMFADGDSITAVSTSLAGSRQDRLVQARESISTAITLNGMRQAGASRLVTVDPHSAQALVAFDGPYTPLTARFILQNAIEEVIADDKDKCLVVAPDEGSSKLMRDYGKGLGLKLGKQTRLMTKFREDPDDPSKVVHEKVTGVKGQTCVLVDDMIDTAGTIMSAAEALQEAGAKRIIVAATHGWFSGGAFDRLRETSPIDQIIVTDTIPVTTAQRELGDRLKVVSVAEMVAESLIRIATGRSVSKLPQGQSYS